MRLPFSARVLLLGVGLAALSVPAVTTVAQASPTASSPTSVTCNGTLAANTYINVTVQSGSCTLGSGDIIQGNVVVQGGGLTMLGTPVQGSVTVQNSPGATIQAAIIQGNVTIQGSAEPMIADNTINGSLVWQSSSTEVYGFGNTVKGNIVVQNSSGGLFEFNTAGGTCTIQNSVLSLSNNSGANPCVVQ
jgi:hypothetical protein